MCLFWNYTIKWLGVPMKSSLLYLVWFLAAQYFSQATPCRIPPRACASHFLFYFLIFTYLFIFASHFLAKDMKEPLCKALELFPFVPSMTSFNHVPSSNSCFCFFSIVKPPHFTWTSPLVLCHNQENTCRQKTILRFISCIFQGLMLSFFKFWTLLLHLF